MFGDNPKAFKIATTGMSPEMAAVELLSNTILTFDLILRFSISHQKKRFCRKPQNIIEFMIEILIFSFVSLEFLLDHEEAAKNSSYALSTLLQILYSLRVFRIFRLIESCSEMKMLKISLLKSKTEFLLFVTVLISFAFIFGSWIFWAELLNPQTFPTIFTGIWWAIVTMTTVGYGDFSPKSTLGYFVGVFTSIFGLILLAMPIATIASNFSKIYDCYNFRKSHLKAKRAKQSNQLFYHRKADTVLQGVGHDVGNEQSLYVLLKKQNLVSLLFSNFHLQEYSLTKKVICKFFTSLFKKKNIHLTECMIRITFQMISEKKHKENVLFSTSFSHRNVI